MTFYVSISMCLSLSISLTMMLKFLCVSVRTVAELCCVSACLLLLFTTSVYYCCLLLVFTTSVSVSTVAELVLCSGAELLENEPLVFRKMSP
jgi:hypothetical protein